ncbi:hypothetical protein G9A89_000363, partial [Geosiphon pyriformis]
MPRRRHSRTSNATAARKRQARERHVHNEESERFLNNVTYCLNCRRSPGNSHSVTGCSLVTLECFSLEKNMLRQKFCLVDKNIHSTYRNDDGILNVRLCVECTRYLKKETIGTDKQNQDWSIVWPAFFWKLLSSESVSKKIGINIWCIIPVEWRMWWLPQFCQLFDNKYIDATIDFPKQVIRDLTWRKKKADKLLSELKLFEIEKQWDKVLECPVLCPFGCCEFVHKTRNFPTDILLARSLELTDEDMLFVTTSPADEMNKKLKGIREDYITFSMSHHVGKLNNPSPDWEILPGIAFVDGEPMLQVCRNCDGGSPLQFLYPPRNPYSIISPPHREQLAAATVQSRVLKTARASSYSDRHQMLHLQGHVNGVDTIRVTTEKCDIVEDQMSVPFDSLALAGREDVRAHVIDLISNSPSVSAETGENWLQRAQKIGRIEQFADFYKSATYIAADVALLLEVDGKTRRKPCVVENVEGSLTGETKMKHFTPVWPRIVPYVHAYNQYGCRFPALYRPQRTKREKALWMTCGAIAMVDIVWRSLAMNDEYRAGSIVGYMLTFAAK